MDRGTHYFSISHLEHRRLNIHFRGARTYVQKIYICDKKGKVQDSVSWRAYEIG